jgi:hypothetical protein
VVSFGPSEQITGAQSPKIDLSLSRQASGAVVNALHNFLPKRKGFTAYNFLGQKKKKISQRSKSFSE